MTSVIFDELDFIGENKEWWDINSISYDQLYVNEWVFTFVGGGANLISMGKEYHKYLVKKFNNEIR